MTQHSKDNFLSKNDRLKRKHPHNYTCNMCSTHHGVLLQYMGYKEKILKTHLVPEMRIETTVCEIRVFVFLLLYHICFSKYRITSSCFVISFCRFIICMDDIAI